MSSAAFWKLRNCQRLVFVFFFLFCPLRWIYSQEAQLQVFFIYEEEENKELEKKNENYSAKAIWIGVLN